jgi:hypothetical protein
MTLPASLAGQANSSLILAEVSYASTPNLGYTITGAVMIADSYSVSEKLDVNRVHRLLNVDCISLIVEKHIRRSQRATVFFPA